MKDLTTLFLIASLFVPRISLLVMYLQGLVPLNPTPFVADVLLSVFIPRAMCLILIASCYGFSGWFWVHLVATILVYAGGGSTVTVTKKQ